MEVLEKVREIISQVCDVPVEDVKETSMVGDFPAWDSIGHLSILSTVEEDLEVSFEPEEMMEMEDVKDIVEAVNAKLA